MNDFTENITALVVDDEPLARQRLSRFLEELGVQVLAQGESGKQALDLAVAHDVDLIFLDINMPGLNGLEAARAIREQYAQDKTVSIIFCTAHDEYAVEAFAVNAEAYLLKPVTKEAVSNSLHQAITLNTLQLKNIQENLNHTVIASLGAKILGIPVSDILYFYAHDKSVFAHLYTGRKVLVDKRLKELETELEAFFVRTHRSYFVNLSYVDTLVRNDSNCSLTLKQTNADEDIITLPISRRYFSAVKKAFTQK